MPAKGAKPKTWEYYWQRIGEQGEYTYRIKCTNPFQMGIWNVLKGDNKLEKYGYRKIKEETNETLL